jgi:hypothetical protein
MPWGSGGAPPPPAPTTQTWFSRPARLQLVMAPSWVHGFQLAGATIGTPLAETAKLRYRTCRDVRVRWKRLKSDASEDSVANERLRSCITGARLTIPDVAAQVGVDPKTVERWIILGRIPHRSHRWATASLLGTDEAYLWPEIADDRRTQAASAAELVTLYSNRGAVPGALWRSLLEAATANIDVLVFSGLFLPDGYPEVAKLLAAKAEQGVNVRLALGDPDSEAVRRRGEEERIGDGLAARVRLSLIYLRDAVGAPGVELRFHATTLYNSIYRFDNDMLVNAHVYGSPAAHSPVLHLRRLPGGRLFDHYQASFERVWEQANADSTLGVLEQRERL